MQRGALLIAMFFLGCAGTRQPVAPPREVPPDAYVPIVDAGPAEPEGPVVPEETSAPEGPSCTTSRECAAGQACRGPRGCNQAWACGEAGACEGERVAYCDCDGATFYAPAGCPGRSYASVGACDAIGPLAAADELGLHDYDEPPTTQDRTCISNAECRRGEQCFGAPGCGMQWRCQRVRGCDRTRVELCDCNGETFRASAQCPGRPYARRGSCEGEAVAAAVVPRVETPRAATPARPQVEHTVAALNELTSEAESATLIERESTQMAASEREPVAISPTPALAPGTCLTSRDCARGQICTGPEGCGMTWTCARPTERCNPDTQVFCDCERNTFRASMTCPGRPYAHRGSCEIDRLLELSGASR